MHVVTVTDIVYTSPTDAPTSMTFGFDEAVDAAYLDAELKAHIEEQTQQQVDTFTYITEEQDQDQDQDQDEI